MYIKVGFLPDDKQIMRKVKTMSTRYSFIDKKFCRRSFSDPYRQCLNEEESEYVLKDIHERTCGNHTGVGLYATR